MEGASFGHSHDAHAVVNQTEYAARSRNIHKWTHLRMAAVAVVAVVVVHMCVHMSNIRCGTVACVSSWMLDALRRVRVRDCLSVSVTEAGLLLLGVENSEYEANEATYRKLTH